MYDFWFVHFFVRLFLLLAKVCHVQLSSWLNFFGRLVVLRIVAQVFLFFVSLGSRDGGLRGIFWILAGLGVEVFLEPSSLYFVLVGWDGRGGW